MYQIHFKLKLLDTDYCSVSMITPDTMSIVVREVRLEVYLNGTFYSSDSYFALDHRDVQLEITDAIYNLLGCSASQDVDVKLKVVTNDQVSSPAAGG